MLDYRHSHDLHWSLRVQIGKNEDKLCKVELVQGSTGVPLVTEHALSVLEARVTDEIDVGTHTLFVGDVVTAEVLRSGEPLTYAYYHTHLKGRSPKKHFDL